MAGNVRTVNTKTSHARGVEAEKKAVEHLQASGYKILKQRYKTPYGEIDIVAEKGGVLCFVEVKARSNMEGALEAVTPRAQKRIENTAIMFIAQYSEYSAYDMRFDVIAIYPALMGGDSVTHLDNAWVAGA